jgi:hypothetical protein
MSELVRRPLDLLNCTDGKRFKFICGKRGSTHCLVAARPRVALQHLSGRRYAKSCVMPAAEGPIAIWDAEPKRSSLDLDSVHDERNSTKGGQSLSRAVLDCAGAVAEPAA